jgi:hypothetical protein
VKVRIKDFSVDMEIKNNGVEFAVANNDGSHRGDLYVSKTGLTWCQGKTPRANGTKLTWDEFIRYMSTR